MSPHERFRIISFVLTTKRVTPIISLNKASNHYSYTIDYLGYILELDPHLSLHIKFKFTQKQSQDLVYWIYNYNIQFFNNNFIEQNMITNYEFQNKKFQTFPPQVIMCFGQVRNAKMSCYMWKLNKQSKFFYFVTYVSKKLFCWKPLY